MKKIEDQTTDTLKLKQGYHLHLSGVNDVDYNPAKVVFHLTKSNGDLVDKTIVSDGDGFSLYDGDIKIIEVDSIKLWTGTIEWIVELDNIVQYNKAGKIILEINTTKLYLDKAEVTIPPK